VKPAGQGPVHPDLDCSRRATNRYELPTVPAQRWLPRQQGLGFPPGLILKAKVRTGWDGTESR